MCAFFLIQVWKFLPVGFFLFFLLETNKNAISVISLAQLEIVSASSS